MSVPRASLRNQEGNIVAPSREIAPLRTSSKRPTSGQLIRPDSASSRSSEPVVRYMPSASRSFQRQISRTYRQRVMNKMNRRTLIRLGTCGLFASVSGCDRVQENDSNPVPVLTLSTNVETIDSEWELHVTVRNNHNWHVSFHNVTVLGFDESGAEVCRAHVGHLLENESASKSTTIACQEFPAIVTATVEESPCDGAKIEIQYWIGTRQQRRGESRDGEIDWESTQRRCEEPIPPSRVVDQVNRTEDDT